MISQKNCLIYCIFIVFSILKQYESSIYTNISTKFKKVDPLDYLVKYGYLEQKTQPSLYDTSRKTSQNYVDLEQALRKFQKFAKLNVTGKLDKATIDTMQLPRCGNHDLSRRKLKRHVLQGSKWAKSVIKFKVKKYPKYSLLDKDVINDELKRAFDLWAQHANIEVQLDDSSEVDKSDYVDAAGIIMKEPIDIDIRFETGFHGDSEPFDGRGLILGKPQEILYYIKFTFAK
jgi:matrix metalloproteinase-14 (membrane-inserted)